MLRKKDQYFALLFLLPTTISLPVTPNYNSHHSKYIISSCINSPLLFQSLSPLLIAVISLSQFNAHISFHCPCCLSFACLLMQLPLSKYKSSKLSSCKHKSSKLSSSAFLLSITLQYVLLILLCLSILLLGTTANLSKILSESLLNTFFFPV